MSKTTHYSKSQIFVQKFNFDKTPTFSRVFHPKVFWQFFSWNQSCQQLKSPKPQHFHEFFTPKIDNFLGKSKLDFWTKNEDFEQYGLRLFCILQLLILHFFKQKLAFHTHEKRSQKRRKSLKNDFLKSWFLL